MHSMCNGNFGYTELEGSQESITLMSSACVGNVEINPLAGRHEATHDQPP